MSGIPWAREPWSEIIPGLWQGGHYYRDTYDLHEAVVRDEFQFVVSLYSRWGHGPDEGVRRRYYKIPDGVLSDAELEYVRGLGVLVANAVEDGKNTLVRCQAGLNRSGLVVGFALQHMGHNADTAIRMIRTARSPYALFNQHFVSYLEAAS